MKLISDLLSQPGGIVLVVLVLALLIAGAALVFIAVKGRKIYSEVAPTLNALKQVEELLPKLTQMTEDFSGEEARPGVPARPGLMERMFSMEGSQKAQLRSLNRLEVEQGVQGTAIESIRHETHFNSGTSIKDATKRTEEELAVVKDTVVDVKSQVTTIKEILHTQLVTPATVSVEVHK